MSRLFSSHRRFIGLGLMSALVIALAVLGTLWGFNQRASANDVGPVSLVHVEPGGADYTGNPYCPDTIWADDDEPIVNAWHDCNNITSQNHVIRTQGWDPTAEPSVLSWNVENASGAAAAIIAEARCGDIAEVIGRAGWVTDNDDEMCLVIHSSTPGETRVTLTYDDGIVEGTIYTTNPVVKEWDSLVDSVILKYGDLEKVTKVTYVDPVTGELEKKTLYLPKDVDNDGDRDADDEDLLDKQGEWQDHGVVFDEALKRIRATQPVQLIEIVHGEHEVLIDSVSVTVRQPTEGALVIGVIDSERNCTYFTDAAGSSNLGQAVTGTSDGLGRFEVYVDTVCEEQAEIHFYAWYPNLPGSLREGLHEWMGINWTTIELAKQPQIRWAGEEIVLAKRWALPDDWAPNADEPICPLASNFDVDDDGQLGYDMDDLLAQGHILDTDDDGGYDTILDYEVDYQRLANSPGALKGQYIDSNSDGVLDTLVTDEDDEGEIDMYCISKAVYDSENPGQVDVEALLLESRSVCLPDADAQDAEWRELGDGTVACIDSTLTYDGTVQGSTVLINKHAFLVWYIKIYQVKLTNVDGERASHNAGSWSFGEGEDTVEDTLNVSQDALLRVDVKGWFFGGDNSGRGAVCVDMDGDGNGLEGDDATEPGVPYQLPMYETGCTDPDDEIVDHGHWVLPDDLAALAGPDAIDTRPNWDVMSEPTAASTVAVGPKSTLDSHDKVLRPWLDYKTVAPDGAITEADAIMPPLKIRASIADADAGFLKQALKGDVYGSKNDYHEIRIPADPEIPAIVNNGGYDWMTYDMPPCPDGDIDGVCDVDDLCPLDFDPTNNDEDGDGLGDVCDDDDDDDGILDDGDDSGVEGDAPCVDGDTTDCDDNCPLNDNADQADADADGVGTVCDLDDTTAGTPATDLDSDGDTIPDAADNCPADANAGTPQVDTDLDGYGDACDENPGLPWWEVPPVPYPFWTIINKSGAPYPNYIEFYTDNRGEGMFFANGDFNLSFDDCRTDPVSGAPVCDQGDVVGESNITVIGDYPYFRKHSAVQSNDVVKTWEWGGFKRVTAERIDATHTAVIAHLVDRDGYCKFAVKSDPTASNGVTFSPSENPVQGEEIEFILNTEVGSIISVSPNGLYSAAHTPLGKASVTGLADGVMVNRSEAVALAEDERVLDYYEEARPVREDDECQAWVVIEHPLGEDPDVSVIFHDPEGDVVLDWPPSELIVGLVQGWNDVCYVDEEAAVEDAMADIIDDVLAVYLYDATDTEDAWKAFFPDNPDLSDLELLLPYDQLFILMAASADWTQQIEALPVSVALVGSSAEDEVAGAWNSVCYAGADKAAEEATSDISSAFVIMYSLGTDQVWRRYVPDRPEIPDTLTTLHRFDSVILLVTAEGGTTWVFDP